MVGLIERDGFHLALRKMRTRTIGPISLKEAIFRLAVSPANLERLNQIRNYRALKAVEAVLADCGPRWARPLPLRAARLPAPQLARHRLDGAHGSKAARALIIKLVERHPSWADPWLELGFIYEDEGADTEAPPLLRARHRGKRATNLASPDPHPGAVATAANRRAAAAGNGSDERSPPAFALAVRQDPGQKVAAAQYAGLLRGQGNIESTPSCYYGEGMYYQECRWCLPPAPVTLPKSTSDTLRPRPSAEGAAGARCRHPPLRRT